MGREVVFGFIGLDKGLLIAIYLAHVIGQGWSAHSVLTAKLFRSSEGHFLLCEFKVLVSSIYQAFRNIVGMLSGNSDGDGIIMLIFSEVELFHRLIFYSRNLRNGQRGPNGALGRKLFEGGEGM